MRTMFLLASIVLLCACTKTIVYVNGNVTVIVKTDVILEIDQQLIKKLEEVQNGQIKR